MKQFDKYFKNKLEHFQIDVPSDTWSKIENKRRKRRKPFFLIFLSISVLLTLGFLFYQVDRNNKEANDRTNRKNSIFESNAKNEIINVNVENNIPNKVDVKSITHEKDKFERNNSNSSIEKVKSQILRSTKHIDRKTIVEDRVRTIMTLDDNISNSQIAIHKESELLSNSDYSLIPKVEFKKLVLPDFIYKSKMPWNSPVVNEQLFSFQSDVFIGPAWGRYRLSINNAEYENVLSKRKVSESSIINYSCGFRLSVLYKNAFGVRLGMVYSDLVNKFELAEIKSIKKEILNISIDTIYNYPMDTMYYRDTLSAFINGERHIRHYNHFRLLNIPVAFLYQKQISSRFIIDFNAGLMFNLFMKSEGRVIDANGMIIEYNSNNNSIFKTKIGVSMNYSLGLSYQLNDHVSLLFEPSYSYTFKPISFDEYPIEQRLSFVSLYYGLRYRF